MTDQGKIPTLVDNFGENTVLNALKQLLPFAQALDVATGTFEIGSLLALDSLWQPLQKIRILMGDECVVSQRGLSPILAFYRRAAGTPCP